MRRDHRVVADGFSVVASRPPGGATYGECAVLAVEQRLGVHYGVFGGRFDGGLVSVNTGCHGVDWCVGAVAGRLRHQACPDRG